MADRSVRVNRFSSSPWSRSPRPLPVLTWSGVTARRMVRHGLSEPATDLSPAGIAGVLCGAHAQMLSAAELSIGRAHPVGSGR
jgi:hypothetical protein